MKSGTPSLLLILVLWIQLALALSDTWRNGEYYSYGWFVFPLAALLAWRRWRELGPPSPASPLRPVAVPLAGALIVAVLLIAPLRLIGAADPGWRPPLLLHVAFVVLVSHILLARIYSPRVSWLMAPITLLFLSAVPYPWQIERSLVSALTSGVLTICREALLLVGQPAELIGERIAVGNEVVEVTDGCSGIRSLQSLVMVALFFGEWLWLAWPARLTLVLAAAACALIVNSLRAFTLAQIQFSRGHLAANEAHDPAGHLAFALSAILLWVSASLLLHFTTKPRTSVRRVVAAPKA